MDPFKGYLQCGPLEGEAREASTRADSPIVL
jgi:hypothetical protein